MLCLPKTDLPFLSLRKCLESLKIIIVQTDAQEIMPRIYTLPNKKEIPRDPGLFLSQRSVEQGLGTLLTEGQLTCAQLCTASFPGDCSRHCAVTIFQNGPFPLRTHKTGRWREVALQRLGQGGALSTPPRSWQLEVPGVGGWEGLGALLSALFGRLAPTPCVGDATPSPSPEPPTSNPLCFLLCCRRAPPAPWGSGRCSRVG